MAKRLQEYAQMQPEYTANALDASNYEEYTTEELWTQAHTAGFKVSVEVSPLMSGVRYFAVRICPFKQEPGSEVMVLCGGGTICEALYSALSAIEQQLWVRLDWAARPWAVEVGSRGTFKLQRPERRD